MTNEYTVQITLTVTLDQLSTITDALKPTTPVTNTESKVVVPPSPTRKIIMPALGRTKEQITSFIESEEERLSLAEEEAQLKAERKAEREAEKASKDKEVEAIKELTNLVSSNEPMPLKKPWEL